MSPEDFRRIALGMDGATEGAHMRHPDFRVHNRIFATLHPDLESGMLVLTPDQQQRVVRTHPAAFAPENGAWGRGGCTRVHLALVDEETLGEAMTLAWQNRAATGGTAGRSSRRAPSAAAPRSRKRPASRSRTR
jgi:YjbR protein